MSDQEWPLIVPQWLYDELSKAGEIRKEADGREFAGGYYIIVDSPINEVE